MCKSKCFLSVWHPALLAFELNISIYLSDYKKQHQVFDVSIKEQLSITGESSLELLSSGLSAEEWQTLQHLRASWTDIRDADKTHKTLH